LVAAALLLAVPAGAGADEGELRVSVGAGVLLPVTALDAETSLTRPTPILDVAAVYAITDFWQIGLALRGGVALGGGRDPEGVGHVLLDGRFVIDALTWVPWLTFGAGLLVRQDGTDAYLGSGSGPDVDPTAHVGLGVDWRPARQWSLGAVARYHLVLTELDVTTGPVEISLFGSLYFD
jgi:hypothetical protein